MGGGKGSSPPLSVCVFFILKSSSYWWGPENKMNGKGGIGSQQTFWFPSPVRFRAGAHFVCRVGTALIFSLPLPPFPVCFFGSRRGWKGRGGAERDPVRFDTLSRTFRTILPALSLSFSRMQNKASTVAQEICKGCRNPLCRELSCFFRRPAMLQNCVFFVILLNISCLAQEERISSTEFCWDLEGDYEVQSVNSKSPKV